MRATVSSNYGNYNLCNPGEWAYANMITIFEDNESIKRVSFVSKEIALNDNDPEELACGIEEFLKTVWVYSGRDECKEMIQFLRANSDAICEGNDRYELDHLIKERNKLNDKIWKVEKRVESYNLIGNKD